MVDIFGIVFPIFCLIGLGYGLIATGILSPAVGDSLSKFVFTIPLPLLVFKTLATGNLSDQSPWSLWIAYFLCVTVVWIVAMMMVRLIFKREGPVLVIAGISAGFSNLVLLGIPIVSGVYGEKGLVPLLLLLSVHLPIMMLASSVLVELYKKNEEARVTPFAIILRVAKSLGKNPIVMGIFAGALWGLVGWPIPEYAGLVIDRITPTAVPLALMAMGMGLRKYGLRGNIMPGFLLALLKNMALPALFLVVMQTLFSLPPQWNAAILLAAACPTGVNAYLLADHFKVGHGIAANTTTLTVLVGLISLPFWIGVSFKLLAG